MKKQFIVRDNEIPGPSLRLLAFCMLMSPNESDFDCQSPRYRFCNCLGVRYEESIDTQVTQQNSTINV